MQMNSTETVPGKEIGEVLGVVTGNTVRAKWFGQDIGADAIVNVRFATSQIMGSSAELLAYGTAVKLT